MEAAKKDKKAFWDKVAGEMCTCGHRQIVHAGVVHHGPCELDTCSCEKYTWSHFVDKNGKKVEP